MTNQDQPTKDSWAAAHSKLCNASIGADRDGNDEARIRAWVESRCKAYVRALKYELVDPLPWNSMLYTRQFYGKIYRLREGIQQYLITDVNDIAAAQSAESQIAVMWDEAMAMQTNGDVKFHHLPGGCNVLYMDGHVSFL